MSTNGVTNEATRKATEDRVVSTETTGDGIDSIGPVPSEIPSNLREETDCKTAAVGSTIDDVRAQVKDLAGQVEAILNFGSNPKPAQRPPATEKQPERRNNSRKSGIKVKLETFSGSEDEDLDDWLARVRRVADYYEWSEDELWENVSFSLSGAAYKVYRYAQDSAEHSFDGLAQVLREHCQPDRALTAVHKFLGIAQKRTESANEFILRFRQAQDRAVAIRPDMWHEEIALPVFRKGVHPDYVSEFLRDEPQSFREAFERLRLAVTIFSARARTTVGMITEARAAENNRETASERELRQTVAALQERVDGLSRTAWQKQQSRHLPAQKDRQYSKRSYMPNVCWACNQKGHFRYECPSLSEQTRQRLKAERQRATTGYTAVVTSPKLFISRIRVQVGTRDVCALLDSCAPLCLLGARLVQHAKSVNKARTLPDRAYSGPAKLTAANGTELRVSEELEVNFCVAGQQVSHYFLVAPELSVEMLLATDFCVEAGVRLDFSHGNGKVDFLNFDRVSVPCHGAWEQSDRLPREQVSLKLVCPITLAPGDTETVELHTPDVGCPRIALWEVRGTEQIDVSGNTPIFQYEGDELCCAIRNMTNEPLELEQGAIVGSARLYRAPSARMAPTPPCWAPLIHDASDTEFEITEEKESVAESDRTNSEADADFTSGQPAPAYTYAVEARSPVSDGAEQDFQ